MDTIINKYLVTEQDDAKRLDAYASSLNSIESRSMAQKLIKAEKILVNGNPSKEAYKVKVGDEITVMIDPPKESHIKAEDIPLDIVYEDDDILVVNKEKGMVVHPGSGNFEGTLVNAIMSHCKDSLSGIGGELRPGIVHRIDKDTSGLLVVAKNDKSHINLSEQIKAHTVSKIYTCLVKGNVPEDKATIDMPIARSQNDRKKMDVDKNGKEAITHFKVLKRYKDCTLLEINIETGRTHQIRVHLSHIGYPIIGDEVYSNGKNKWNIEGQCLHAKSLDFRSRIT